MTRKHSKQLIATAYHEAGHAVAAHFLKIPITKVTIEPDDDSLGHVRRKNLPRPVYEALRSGGLTLHMIDKIERNIIMPLAGGAAERRHRGRSNYVGSWQDRDRVVDFVDRLSASGEEASAYYRLQLVRARGLIESKWYAVEAVAQALLAATTLTGEDVKRIVHEAMRQQHQAMHVELSRTQALEAS